MATIVLAAAGMALGRDPATARREAVAGEEVPT